MNDENTYDLGERTIGLEQLLATLLVVAILVTSILPWIRFTQRLSAAASRYMGSLLPPVNENAPLGLANARMTRTS